jgi:hypothetical protein
MPIVGLRLKGGVAGEGLYTHYSLGQCCGSEPFYYGSGSDFQKVTDPVSDPTSFLNKYDFNGPTMTL